MKHQLLKRQSLRHIKGKVSEPTYDFLKTVNAVSNQEVKLNNRELTFIIVLAVLYPWISTKNLLVSNEASLIFRSVTSFSIVIISISSQIFVPEQLTPKFLAPISLNVIYLILSCTNVFLILFSDKNDSDELLESSKVLQLRDLIAYLISYLYLAVRFELEEKLFKISTIFNITLNTLIILIRALMLSDKLFYIDLFIFCCYLVIVYGIVSNLSNKITNLLQDGKNSAEIIAAAQKLDTTLTKEKERLERDFLSPFSTSKTDILIRKLRYIIYKQKNEVDSKQNIIRSDYPKKNSLSIGNTSSSFKKLSSFEQSQDQQQQDSKWELSPEDIESILKLLIQDRKNEEDVLPECLSQVGSEIPQKRRGQRMNTALSQEATNFLLKHFTEGIDVERQLSKNIKGRGGVMGQQLNVDSLSFAHLQNLGEDFSLDLFRVNQLNNNNTLMELSNVAYRKFDLGSILNCPSKTFDNFSGNVQKFYIQQNPYHNAIHGADVTSNVCYFLKQGLAEPLSDIELAALIVSALVHDVGHPGLNNAFLVATKSKQAMIYNDQSVLENFHITTFFSILRMENCNILEGLNDKDWRYFRKLSIQIVLDTDLQKHFLLMNKFKNSAITLAELNYNEEANRHLALSIAIKCADVGHGAKSLPLHKLWSRRIIEEFYLQGDMESKYNLPISPLCDRQNNKISKSQEGFLKCIVLPIFEIWDKFYKTDSVKTKCTEQIKFNIEYWNQQMELEEQANSTFLTETNHVLTEFKNSLENDKESVYSSFI